MFGDEDNVHENMRVCGGDVVTAPRVLNLGTRYE